MSLFAHLVYSSLMWNERRRAGSAIPQPENPRGEAIHLATGRQGEALAYWYLRSIGYLIVARNLRMWPDAGELDLVGWDGKILAFVEVKTRTSDAAGPPETAVTLRQQERIAQSARFYVRRLRQKAVNYRFDIVSVAWEPQKGYTLRLIKDAFKAGES